MVYFVFVKKLGKWHCLVQHFRTDRFLHFYFGDILKEPERARDNLSSRASYTHDRFVTFDFLSNDPTIQVKGRLDDAETKMLKRLDFKWRMAPKSDWILQFIKRELSRERVESQMNLKMCRRQLYAPVSKYDY